MYTAFQSNHPYQTLEITRADNKILADLPDLILTNFVYQFFLVRFVFYVIVPFLFDCESFVC